jgi:hypothetical protein
MTSTPQQRCDTCGRFLGFAELCFSEHHFTPLNEFGPEESSFTGPCCRYRDVTELKHEGEAA